MNIKEINDTIAELENGDTTYTNCQKLSSLYIVRNFLTGSNDKVVKEYNDILPSYSTYVECKRKYQMGNYPLEYVENEFKALLSEVNEFLDTLYISTENNEERAILRSSLDEFKKTHA